MTRLRCRRARGMQLLKLLTKVLVEIAKHLEPYDPSLGAFCMLSKSTRNLTVVRLQYCGRIMEFPWLHALWPGVVLRNLIIRDSFKDRVLQSALHGATYPHVHSLQLDLVLSPHSVKNVFKVFPNLKELIVHRSAICVHRHTTLQSEHQSDHTDAMVDFLAQQTGAQVVELLCENPEWGYQVFPEGPGRYGWYRGVCFKIFNPTIRNLAPACRSFSDWDPMQNDNQFTLITTYTS